MKTIENKKYIVKIPDKVHIFFCKKKKIIIIKGPLTQKSLKIETKIKIKKNVIEVTSTPISKQNNLQKKLKEKQGVAVSLLRQLVTDTRTTTYKKLKFKGVQNRASYIENNLLLLKLGYSHLIYVKIPKNFKIFCFKFKELLLGGNSYKNVMASASLIRSKKSPDPYKGGGILYENEIIKLKKYKKS